MSTDASSRIEDFLLLDDEDPFLLLLSGTNSDINIRFLCRSPFFVTVQVQLCLGRYLIENDPSAFSIKSSGAIIKLHTPVSDIFY